MSYKHFVRPAFAYLLCCVVNYTLTGYGLSMAILDITLETRVIFPQDYPHTVYTPSDLTYIFPFLTPNHEIQKNVDVYASSGNDY